MELKIMKNAMQKHLTKQKSAEILNHLREADMPFVHELSKLYAMVIPAIIIKQDMTIERSDPHECLPADLKKIIDELQDLRKQSSKQILLSYGIEPQDEI